MVEVINQLFCDLNGLLLKVSQGDTENEILNNLLRLYNSLCNASLSLSEYFSTPMLIALGNIFILLTSALYIMYIMNWNVLLEEYEYKFAQIGWLLWYGNMVNKAVRSASITSNKAKEFNTLLYQIMIDDKTNEIASNKKLRLHIAMKREVVFTACGFFNLDYSLIHSMIAAATTYLVILIQFGQPTATSQTTSSTILNDTISENFTSFTTPFTPFFTTTLS